MLPQLSREGAINLANSIKNMNGNSTIYGQFKNGVITISENASRGTLYHEAFHYVTQSLLSENELSNLYNQAKTKYGNLENITSEDLKDLCDDLVAQLRTQVQELKDSELT